MKYTGLLLLLFTVFNFTIHPNDFEDLFTRVEKTPQQEDLREEAFHILRDKCNTCHTTKKRTDIFTKENMDVFATEIYEQVFIKKKMPKGRKVKLTESETLSLNLWIDTVLEKK